VVGLPLHIAADRLGIPAIQLREWEEGYGGPKIGQLRRMSQIYKKPLATLLRASLPKNEKPIDADFRLLTINQEREWSNELWLALWRVQLQHDVASDLARVEEDTPPPLSMNLSLADDPERAGLAVREWLEGSAPQAVNAYGKRDFSQWVSFIEAQGILVTQISGVALDEMRGCSLSDQPFPVIALNSQDSPNGRIFTLMHELIHILLKDGGLCDLEDKQERAPEGREAVERFCNAVSAAILIPEGPLRSDWRVMRSTPSTGWVDEDIAALAQLFGVSREAIVLRLVGLGRAPWSLYRDLRPRYERAWEEVQRLPNTSHFFGQNQRKVRDFGRRYSTTVLNAYRRDDITALDAADYMDTTIGNLPKLAERLGLPQ
jgi:Zn-dependent peptidase ImmA (M78 family)